MKHPLLAILLSIHLVPTAGMRAQDSTHTCIDYRLTAETAVGSGDYTALLLAANRHHTLSTRPNTASMRGALSVRHQLGQQWRLEAAADAIVGLHADHQAYLQQCYANLIWRNAFHLEAGSREISHPLRHPLLSTGGFVNSTNAKPIPQIRIGTDGFWTVPHTKGWLQIDFDFGYGKFVDDNYREDAFRENSINRKYTKGILYHQKRLYFRTNPEKRFFLTAGIDHAVQFGGTQYEYADEHTLIAKHKRENLRAFWEVILPLGDSKYFENESMEDWVFGNHIGSMTIQVGCNIDSRHQLQAYVDDPFEDGSGMRKGNGWDGLYGLQYQNRTKSPQLLRGAVVEYLQTTNQSGPLHWDRGDYPEPIRSQITDLVTGNDEYYNHSFYDAYAHYGMTPGNPLILSPRYNRDGSSSFRDNRVKAWSVAVNGEVGDRLSYLLKAVYREGWGTYYRPIYPKHHSFDALLQAIYSRDPWQVAAAYAFDRGNTVGDCSTFNLKIGYHGKIL
jgi:hypothetical protein